jgi:hypothetical protein
MILNPSVATAPASVSPPSGVVVALEVSYGFTPNHLLAPTHYPSQTPVPIVSRSCGTREHNEPHGQ